VDLVDYLPLAYTATIYEDGTWEGRAVVSLPVTLCIRAPRLNCRLLPSLKDRRALD
jgi:hypothetical protein